MARHSVEEMLGSPGVAMPSGTLTLRIMSANGRGGSEADLDVRHRILLAGAYE